MIRYLRYNSTSALLSLVWHGRDPPEVCFHLFHRPAFTLHAGLLMGLFRGWQLALVLLGLVPAIGGLMGVAISLVTKLTNLGACM